MDRLILGKAPEKDSNSSDTYYRAGNTGLFISKPGANVLSCSDGDLLFDSTSDEFMQVMAKGTVQLPVLSALQTSPEDYLGYSSTVVDTGIQYPHAEELATMFVTFDLLVSSSNLHPDAYSSNWNSPTGNYVRVPQSFGYSLHNLGKPNSEAAGVSDMNRPLVTATVFSNTFYFIPPTDRVEPFFSTTSDSLIQLPSFRGTSSPQWSPAGDKIAFLGMSGDEFDGVSQGSSGGLWGYSIPHTEYFIQAAEVGPGSWFPNEIYTVPVDQNNPTAFVGTPTKLTDNLTPDPADVTNSDNDICFNGDGTKLVSVRWYTRDSSGFDTLLNVNQELLFGDVYYLYGELWIMNATPPANPTRLLFNADPEVEDFRYLSPHWSPVDDKIVYFKRGNWAYGSAGFESTYDIAYYDISTGDETIVYSGNRHNWFHGPRWNPTGTKIGMFDNFNNMWTINPDGTGLKRIFNSGAFYYGDAQQYGLEIEGGRWPHSSIIQVPDTWSWTPDGNYIIINSVFVMNSTHSVWPSLGLVADLGNWPESDVWHDMPVKYDENDNAYLRGIVRIDASGNLPDKYETIDRPELIDPSSGVKYGSSISSYAFEELRGRGMSISPNGKYILYERNNHADVPLDDRHQGSSPPTLQGTMPPPGRLQDQLVAPFEYLADLRILKINSVTNNPGIINIEFKNKKRSDGWTLADRYDSTSKKLNSSGNTPTTVAWTLYKAKGTI